MSKSAIYQSKDLVSCDDLYYMSINKYSNCYFMYKSFLFFRSEELEHLERFELPISGLQPPALPGFATSA